MGFPEAHRAGHQPSTTKKRPPSPPGESFSFRKDLEPNRSEGGREGGPRTRPTVWETDVLFKARSSTLSWTKNKQGANVKPGKVGVNTFPSASRTRPQLQP